MAGSKICFDSDIVDSGMSYAYMLFITKNGYKPIRFYKYNEECKCDICNRYSLYWWCLEGYADCCLEIYMGDIIEKCLVDRMNRVCCTVLDKYKNKIFPRELTSEEYCNWYLGLLSGEYFNKLSDDLKEICEEFREGRPLIKDDVLAAYMFKVHEGWCAGKQEERDYFTL